MSTCGNCGYELIGDEAFTEEELAKYARQCKYCPRTYQEGFYSEHADKWHNLGRTAYWRERQRTRKKLSR